MKIPLNNMDIVLKENVNYTYSDTNLLIEDLCL
jgi:hypothetical protein